MTESSIARLTENSSRWLNESNLLEMFLYLSHYDHSNWNDYPVKNCNFQICWKIFHKQQKLQNVPHNIYLINLWFKLLIYLFLIFYDEFKCVHFYLSLII